MCTQTRFRVPRSLIAAAAAFGLLLVLVPPSQGAREVAPACGDTITASVRLTSDVVGCTGIGLVVGAAAITIDLNGHTLGGTNTPKSVGIENDGHANVRIVNGTVKNFHLDGIAIHNARGNTIGKVTVTGIGAGGKQNEADAGILLDHSPAAAVSDSVVMNHVHAFQSDGIDVLFSSGALIQRNRLSQNAWNGLVVIKSPRSRVVGNQLDGNGNNGMEANGASDFVYVSGNHADRNTSWGLVLGALAHARVLGNSVSGNGQDGLFFFDLTSSTIQRNHASANATGINLAGGQHGSKLNQILGNTVTRNKHAGIWVNGQSGKSPANQNLVSGNTATGNGSPGGIVVDGTARGNRLRGNTATGNTGHGISAVSGTIDGGGNHARGNRAAPQCVGVVCT
jgi:parallel beta-helix repeat protein